MKTSYFILTQDGTLLGYAKEESDITGTPAEAMRIQLRRLHNSAVKKLGDIL